MASNAVPANPEIRPLGPLDEARDKQILIDLFAQGNGARDAARKSGLSSYQVTQAKKRWGLTSAAVPGSEMPDKQGANAGFAAKMKADRAKRYAKWQGIAELLQDRIYDGLSGDKTVTTILRGAMGIEGEEVVDQVPARDLRELLSGLGVAETHLQKIAALEDDQGLARGLSVLEKFSEAAAMLAGTTLPAPREGLIQE
ncbi:terminase small subunit [Microbacterium phage Sucha]|nr:terminase small subunit [Microbacterium phage Sucha]